ncbi:DUF4139 domain-containing protein [Mesorhizobium sp. SB112]|uniref:DUF4139 domain-containing protein n=1 Tax=Mesorhizobium sp. SB112 TaxID=3151853 RepID=UPI003263B440
MKKSQNPRSKAIRAAMASAVVIGAVLATPVSAEENSSKIEAITLSSGGLAEIRRNASADGSTILRLEVPLEHVDDILKSLVVRDPEGTVGAMTLDGLSPVEETFRRLPFTPEQMGSLPDLAASLQGVKIRASSGGRTLDGVVLGVSSQKSTNPENDIEERVLSVMADNGEIKVLRMGTDTALSILDDSVLEKVREAANVSGRGRTDEIRVISLELSGERSRSITLTYLVPAPVWKAAYRLVIGNDQKARLQAWAVVENATGEDWDEIALTLSSGAPVTLSQHLHQRYWHERQVVPVTAGSTSAPRPDNSKAMISAAGAAPALRRSEPFAEVEASFAGDMAALAPASRQAEQNEGMTSATYRLPQPVDLKAGQTLSLPFVDDEVPAERVSVFQPGRNENHPIAALFLKNDSPGSLPPGILTVYDDQNGYVGDAQLAGLPAGESRMASFAADRKVEVATQTRPEENISQISVVDGSVRITRLSRVVTTYTIKGAADAPRTVIIEHPRRDGWNFTSESLDSVTPTHQRLRTEIEPRGQAEVVATDEMKQLEVFALVDASSDALFGWAGSVADSETASKFTKLAELRRGVAEAERVVGEIERDLDRASEGQSRIRENLAAVPADSALGQRYVVMLEQEEDNIEGLGKRRGEAETKVEELQEEVAAFIRTF